MSNIAKTRFRSRPPRSRLSRFLRVGVMLARVYIGYRRISFRERRRGKEWGAERRRKHHRWSANKFYETAIRNQGLLIKTAQFLSSRSDFMPEEYVEVLSQLQDEVPPEPFKVIRKVVEQELGRPIEEVFEEFEERPVASASLAQVHHAVLKDGRVAAVKVQYPGIDKIVAIDLKNIRRYVNILSRIDRGLDFRFIAEEMGKMIPKELDFINEGRNAEAIAANFADVEDIVVPRIYWDYTTKRVLTMEFLNGVKITDTVAVRAMGVDTADVAKILVVAFSEMLLRHGLFHADPHPGNLMVAPGPRLVLLDFGQVKDVGPDFRSVFAQMTRALIAADDAAMGRSFRDLGFRMKQDTDKGYEQLGNAYVGHIARRMAELNQAWAEGDMFRDSYGQLMRVLRSNPVTTVPPDLLFVGRVMGLLNGLSKTLQSRTNLLLEMARLLERDGAAGVAGAPARRLLDV
jgi:predicted unusual protein kinase regulating ubiquinone biosynthesis (AarF/ABC1/UbiB family)